MNRDKFGLFELWQRISIHGRLSALPLLLLTQFVTISVLNAQDVAPSPLSAAVDPLVNRKFLFSGSASCAASSCHGGRQPGQVAPTAPMGSEYGLYLENDPHARSWRTLCSDQSVSIMERLGILAKGEVKDLSGYMNCLACHSTPPNESIATDPLEYQSSISCEACHGPAENWQDTHFRADWNANNAQELGMVDTTKLLSRARMCASCHVGDSDRDMNHDIIAAGHPALYFEMAADHDRLPKHWRDEAELKSPADYRARLWLAGQIASADAELELLRARQQGSHTISVWPELANFECSRCHFSLQIPSQLESNDRPAKWTGRPQLRTWNLRSLVHLKDLLQTIEDDSELSVQGKVALLELETSLVESGADHTSSATDSQKTVMSLVAAMGGDQLENWDFQKQQALVQSWCQQEAVVSNWEASGQAYLAARLAFQSQDVESVEPQLNRIRASLQFSTDSQSPPLFRSKPNGKNNSTSPLSPDRIKSIDARELRELFQVVAAGMADSKKADK